MSETKKAAAPPGSSSRAYLASRLIAAVIVSVLVYRFAGSLLLSLGHAPLGSSLLNAVQQFMIGKASQVIVAILAIAPAVYTSLTKFRDLRRAELARQANAQVADELSKLKGRTAVADISTKEVTDSLKDVKVDSAQLARIVEQHKQQLLVDDEYFRAELRDLIVTYLQPLPRNAKRLVNRFRVNLLIANSRGLLTTEPKVTAQQIGKWMVLLERWPQLGRSLSALPAKMKVLEDESAVSPDKPKIVEAQPSQTAPAPQTAAPDEFMQTVKILAEPYCGDEDLRKFIHSDPRLETVLSRLVHYGSPASETNS